MESTVEQRLTFLENRVKTLEGLLQARNVPFPAPAVVPPAAKPERVEMSELPAEFSSPKPEPPIDIEELLGGRVLGWVGGIAVAIAAIFFVVMAVHNGWIGVDARDLEPDHVCRVVRDALGVGVREAHADRDREREALHGRRAYRGLTRIANVL